MTLRNSVIIRVCMGISRSYRIVRGKRGGLMVSVLDSGASGPGSSPGLVLGQDTLLSVPLSTQVYKRVPANLGNPAMD